MIWTLFVTAAFAAEITTNELSMHDAPAWLKSGRVQRVVDQIETKLEWDIRKVQVYWYTDEAAFEKTHGFGPSVLAITKKQENLINIGPRVGDADFDSVFGHELVHVIVYQKYGEAIPKWLEEGLANYEAKHGKVDYAWLAKQPAQDVTTLEHPFKALTADGPRYHYQASTALMEMFASKCDVDDLVHMSVGKKLESYLPTLCEITDLNAEFKKWVEKKAKRAGAR